MEGPSFDPSQVKTGLPEIPPIRTFKVIRVVPGSEGKDPVKEEVLVRAHSLQFAGPILQFLTFCIIEGEPTSITNRGFYGWQDYEDITGPTIESPGNFRIN